MALSLAGCNPTQQQQAAAPPPPPAVGVVMAQMRGVAPTYSFVGRVKAVDTVQLRARVEGFLEKVLFIEGDQVKTGELLYQIEKTQYQAAVEQAKANLAAAEAQELNAQLQFNRSAELVKSSSVPQSVNDQNRANLDSAKASIMQNKAALTIAEENLGYTDIASPIDGRVGLTTYTQGNLVNPTSGVLATIVSDDPIYVEFPVSMRQIADIMAAHTQDAGGAINIKVYVQLANRQEYAHPGVWNYIGNQVDPLTDTLLVRATFPNPERELVDGAFTTVEVRDQAEKTRLVIPRAALQLDQAGVYVLVVDKDRKVEVKRVTTGEALATDIAIPSGLDAGDRVIVDGVQKVRPGQVVEATELSASGGAQK
ncbi:MAG TPA: efflux RND transporter periplasmic adaptor subunit [Roseiarcus sp.]|nr:efflux RND transporter periplasmic adaptor subunit [Roseiarcus sp.]